MIYSLNTNDVNIVLPIHELNENASVRLVLIWLSLFTTQHASSSLVGCQSVFWARYLLGATKMLITRLRNWESCDETRVQGKF